MSSQTTSAAYAINPTSTQAVTPQALLNQLSPYISQTASVLLTAITFLTHALGFLISKISYPIFLLSPLPIILYLLSPAIVFAEVVLDMLVATSYHISLYLLDAFYPVYVLCGVACIVGALLGIGGRMTTTMLVDMAVGPNERRTHQPSLRRNRE
jgi:hypothetical protein